MRLRERNPVRIGFRGLVKVTCRPDISGLDHIPDTGGFIVASNHLSFFDSVLLQSMLPRLVRFFAKAEYFTAPGIKGKLQKSFFESVGSIPVDRGQKAASVAALDRLVEFLDKGEGVGIYPDGTRSRDGRLYRGKTGVGWLALTTGAPVIPVGLTGTDRLQPPGRNLIVPHKFGLTVGEPLQFEKIGPKHKPKLRRQITDEIMDAIAQLTGQERVDSYNSAASAEQDTEN